MAMIRKLLEGYGSFFALNQPLSKALILFCALLQPSSGLLGLLGGLGVLLAHRLLQFQAENERIEIVNGILFGMLVGSLYAPSALSAILTLAGALLVSLTGAFLADILRQARLPLLGLPYAIVSFMILPVAAWLNVPLAPLAQIYTLPLPLFLTSLLNPLGAIYFNGTPLGGLLVLTGFAVSSRYLALIAIAASFISYVYLSVLGISTSSTLFLIAQMNGVLTACVIGSLYAVPGRRSVIVALMAALITCTVALCLARLLWVFSLPALALPFVLVTYCCLVVFTARRGRTWACFWLSSPSLPETSLERILVAKVRGIDSGSIALRAPFAGSWQVYQGFEGDHTHRGQWRYALDFFQVQRERSFVDSGASLQDFHCFGKPVVSPAFGTVVSCRADLPDNRPGDVDTTNNWGNFILIRLDCGLYVMLAHLQRNSVRVQVNHRVHPGMMLAAVGNSGRSPQPHLHMHVQEDAVPGSVTVPFHLTAVLTQRGEDFVYALSAVPGEKDNLVVPTNNIALKRALRLTVGTRFDFDLVVGGSAPVGRSVEVKLDIYGQFRLETDSGASMGFTLNDDFLAVYNRVGPKDELLDGLMLSLGMTPLTEGRVRWNDLVPRRILPLGRIKHILVDLFHPFSPCAQSSFVRQWDNLQRVWLQTAEHKLGPWKIDSEVRLCEANGLLGFTMAEGGKTLMVATLKGVGMLEDNGIPATNRELPAQITPPRKVSAA
ncbi:MAG: urea transporter [Candidatus Obscuribacterales bacterium]|nr:urea transporter [Candidatus Obscuribacterales bacterium]